MKQDRENPL